MLDIPILFITAAWRKWRRAAARRKDFKTALAHNRVHTYECLDSRLVGGTWCCPSCNTIHGCVSHNQFTGRQFPACCEFKEGHRLHRSHATDI